MSWMWKNARQKKKKSEVAGGLRAHTIGQQVLRLHSSFASSYISVKQNQQIYLANTFSFAMSYNRGFDVLVFSTHILVKHDVLDYQRRLNNVGAHQAIYSYGLILLLEMDTGIEADPV